MTEANENKKGLKEQFLDYLRDIRKLSENTLEAYRHDLNAFERFLKEEGGPAPEDVTSTNIVAYLMYMKNEGRSKSTVNRRLASARAFYRFLIGRGIVEEDPTADIRSPRIARKEIQYLSAEEVLSLLALPDDTVKGKRDRAILELMYATGIRVSEAIELKLSDLNLRMGFVAVSGNHGGARIVPIGVPARRAVRDYLEHSRPVLMKDGDPEDPAGPVFVNFTGGAFTRQGFWRVLADYGKQSGLGDRLTPQSLRNSFAMHMVENGIDIISLQELMGHEDITATEAYFGGHKTRIKDVYDRTHPRAK